MINPAVEMIAQLFDKNVAKYRAIAETAKTDESALVANVIASTWYVAAQYLRTANDETQIPSNDAVQPSPPRAQP